MPPTYIIAFIHVYIIILICVTETNSWRRRRRRRCSTSHCQVSPWSSWSSCSAVQCGIAGSKHRSRHVIAQPACGGTPCPPNMQDTAICYGKTAFGCQYSRWSTWSPCPAVGCEETQTSRRQIMAREQCGGTPCNMTALRKTRPCKQTFCINQGTLHNGKCFCKTGFTGSCCQFNSKWSRIGSSRLFTSKQKGNKDKEIKNY